MLIHTKLVRADSSIKRQTDLCLSSRKQFGYLIGIIAAVQIDNGWTMNNDSPMQPLPEGSTWKVWCSIFGTIPQVWVTPSVVYIS